ncbi:Leucine rich repeat [Popillia japonica]|uniref:Leucine rich repeat n=1 Tax=Popillia japonica TaxID=7064 RepID=A0AAW1K250_POPJA
MRFPHIINDNTRIEYTPAEAALDLQDESDRKVKAEDFEWDSELCPLLSTLCIQAIAKNFSKKPLLDELPCHDRLYLLEILSTDLDLEIVVPLIENEIYWKRRYKDKFGVAKDTKHIGWTWKCLYLEKHVQKMIAEAQPQYSDEDGMDDILKLLNPYIHKLRVAELQSWKPPLTWEKHDIPSVYPTDHIDFNPILLPLEYIEELDITYGMRNVGTEFTWNMFKLSVVDCRRLGKAILPLKLLKIFRLHGCAVDDDRVRALSQNLIKHKTIVELDLSHCLIADQGVTGAEGIGYALLQDGCCPLVHLDLRLNPLGHDGVMGIFRALVRGSKPEEINIAACLFEDNTADRLCQVLMLNSTLKWLDVSCNWFSESASESILQSMATNKSLHWLDLRDTDIPHEIVEGVNKYLLRNRLGLDDLDESITSDEKEDAEVEDEDESKLVETIPEKIQANESSDED